MGRGHLFIFEKVIIELNTAMPSFEGLHDITMTDLPPRRKPYLIMAPEGIFLQSL
jgi:acetyl-CoA hydrolase